MSANISNSNTVGFDFQTLYELETLNIDACTKLYLFLKPNHSKAKNNDMSLKIFYYKTVDILSLK
jgi:hypothetical protein